MTIQLQENKKIAVTFIEEVVNNRKLHLIDEIFFPDYTSHEKNGNDENNIKDGSLPSCLEYLFKAFPDLHYKVIDVIADIRKPFR